MKNVIYFLLISLTIYSCMSIEKSLHISAKTGFSTLQTSRIETIIYQGDTLKMTREDFGTMVGWDSVTAEFFQPTYFPGSRADYVIKVEKGTGRMAWGIAYIYPKESCPN